MATRLRSVVGLFAIVALACASAVATGCLTAGPANPSTGVRAGSEIPGVTYGAHAAGTSRPFVDRTVVDSQELGRTTPDELGGRLGVDLRLPAKAAGGEFQGIYEPSDQGSYAAIYSNDVVVIIRPLRDQKDAADWITHYINGDIAYHVTKWDLRGTEAYAIPKLDIEPVLSSETINDGDVTLTKTKPGTGISTSSAEVCWQRDRFVIQVMNPDQSVSALKEIARSVEFEPREPTAP
jgi:hypothetical protein